MGGWDYSLLDITKAPLMCLWGCLVPFGCCCMQGISTSVARPSKKEIGITLASLVCLCNFGMAFNRYRLRKSLSIEDSPITDCAVSLFLPCCSVTQEWMHVMNIHKGTHDYPIWKVVFEELGNKKKS